MYAWLPDTRYRQWYFAGKAIGFPPKFVFLKKLDRYSTHMIFSSFRQALCCLYFFGLCMPGQLFAQQPPTPPRGLFVENKGQWPAEVLFRAELPAGGFLFLKKQGLQFSFYDGAALRAQHPRGDSAQNLASTKLQAYSYTVAFAGSSRQARAQGRLRSPTAYHFYQNKKQYHAAAYAEVYYEGIYEGIDLKIFAQEQKLKYEFYVQPQADARQIALQYQHLPQAPRIEQGDLLLQTPLGTVREKAPYSYQGERSVGSAYRLEGNVMRFALEEYRRNEMLVIDPELVFSTFSGAFSDNWGNTATFDAQGHLYSGGIAFGAGFPTTTGAFDVDFNGLRDVGILKFSPDGSQLLYATYLGGNNTEVPHSLVVNQEGHLLVLGSTSSTNFPTTPGVIATQFQGGVNFTPILSYSNGSDLFLAKLSADGSSLLQATYLGGSNNDGVHRPTLSMRLRNYGDEFRGDVFVDADNYIYIASSTFSNNFPTKNAQQATFQGLQDALVMKLQPDLSDFVWSTYLGGSAHDFAHSIKVNAQGEVYVAGTTNSSNFPTTAQAFQPAYPPGRSFECGFVAHFSPQGELLHSTLLTGGMASQAYFLDLDPEGNVFVLGIVEGAYPISEGVYANENSGQFIQKLSPDLSQGLLATTVGTGSGFPDISPTAFLVNECGNIYLTGWGGIINFFGGYNFNSTTSGLPVTPDAFQPATNGSNFYIMVLEEDFRSLAYATFIGGSSGDHVDGGTSRFDKSGKIYHAVCACGGSNDDFPTTPGAWSNTNNSFNCNNAAFKFDTEILTADFEVLDPLSLQPISQICASEQALLRYVGSGARQIRWEIEDIGVFENQSSLLITFPETSRSYNISLQVVNVFSCTREINLQKSLSTFPTDFRISPPVSICQGNSTLLEAAGLGGGTFRWQPESGLSDPQSPTPLASPAVTTLYTVAIEDANGCQEEASVLVSVQPALAVDFRWELIEDCGKASQVWLSAAYPEADALRWYIEQELIAANEAELRYTFVQAGSYTLRLEVEKDGCIWQKSIVIEVKDTAAPLDNVITPNGDGIHDTFRVIGEGYRVEIFNRFGKRVFESERYQNNWGEGVPAGVYYYLITSPQGQQCKGWIQVLR